MSSLNKSIESKFNELRLSLKENRGKWISANGANALILVYPPKEEGKYLNRVKTDYEEEYIINLADLFVEFVDEHGINVLKEAFRNYRSTPESLFNNEDSAVIDLFDLIKQELKTAIEKEKIPVLIRTGILYGTHIENKFLLEKMDFINNYHNPLIILYPAEVKKDINDEEIIHFLGVKKASDYRGQLI
ncbi:MAG: hypothetical protein ACQERJ_10425 [Bacillota bacterium]